MKRLLWLLVFIIATTALARSGPQLERAIRNGGERQQVAATLLLIDRGGPFPSSRDGSVFFNRDGQLPRQSRGYYREYTVPTPGVGNRGARRIIKGHWGETYYTRDHYRTFVRLDGL